MRERVHYFRKEEWTLDRNQEVGGKNESDANEERDLIHILISNHTLEEIAGSISTAFHMRVE